jgi:hypothetical protein
MDLLLHYDQNRRVSRGLPATDPALDLQYLATGEPLAVVAHRRQESRLRPGTLILHTESADPVVWFPGRFPRRAASGFPMRSPVEVEAVSEVTGQDKWRVKSWQFCVVDAQASGEPWTLAIPIIDLELVLTAFATTTPAC